MPTVRRFPTLPEVKCRGQALGSPVHWLGTQWAVTADGVERRDGLYVIERDRIHEVHDSAPGTHPAWTWELHIGRKGWADMEDFRAAMAFALRKWPKAEPLATSRPARAGSARPGKSVSNLDIVFVNQTSTLSGVVRKAGRTGSVELHRLGRKASARMPAEQAIVLSVDEIQAAILVLRQAQAKAIEKGLLGRASGAA